MRIAIMAAALLVAAVGVVVTAVFLCLALYAYLLTMLAAPLAALASALIVFVLSIVVIFLGGALGSLLAARARRRRAQRGGRASFISAEIGRLLGENAQSFVSEKPMLSLIIALAGGFAIGANPRLRSFLQTILNS
ncbi:MAG: hypothetical protein KGJ78_09470 [Alphaproteobacteria bacterium]|nr:hypothetical protein [Alphaproteobacteria bacterium]